MRVSLLTSVASALLLTGAAFAQGEGEFPATLKAHAVLPAESFVDAPADAPAGTSARRSVPHWSVIEQFPNLTRIHVTERVLPVAQRPRAARHTAGEQRVAEPAVAWSERG